MSGLLDCVADSAGFEPATARFVAEYSIQLSYESVLVVLDQITTGGLKCLCKQSHFKNGGLSRIRTCDRSVRSRVLYPAEL